MTYWHPATSEQANSLQEFTDEEIANIDSVNEEVDLEEFAKEFNAMIDEFNSLGINNSFESWLDEDCFVEP